MPRMRGLVSEAIITMREGAALPVAIIIVLSRRAERADGRASEQVTGRRARLAPSW